MGKLKKALASALTVMIVVSGMVLPAQAADSVSEHNQSVEAMVAEISQKYYIDIEYPYYTSNGVKKASIDTAMLKNLDEALSYATPSLVRQVSNFYEDLCGRRIRYVYIYSNMYTTGEVIIGAFDERYATIELYMPPNNSPSVTAFADPLTVLHEFGHAFHLMYMRSYGRERMQREWTAFNSGNSYSAANIINNPNSSVFVSGYAATMFEEDVAETFAHAFVRNRAGLGFTGQMSQNGQVTSLGKKVQYVEKMLPRYLSNTEQAVANFRKTYSTPSSIVYNEMKFSGAYLQYAGYHETRSLLAGALKFHGKRDQVASATWITEIGSWYVKYNNGSAAYLFPDYSYADVGGKVKDNSF